MELLERQAEIETLTRHLQEAGTGAGRLTFLCGEAGIGKSALVEHFVKRAKRGTRLLWGHCDALETSRVLGPLNEVASEMNISCATGSASAASREQLFPDLLARLSAPNPLSVVVLEDLHWADESTLDFVRFIGRRIQHTRCLLLATYRDDELPFTHPLRTVLGALTGEHIARIRLLRLSPRAVAQLAHSSGHDSQHVYDVTGGNPFFVREILAAPSNTVPETVRDAVLSRLSQCPKEARQLAELVSLLPGGTELWLARAIFGDVAAAVDATIACGLLNPTTEMLTFRHELGRLAIESTLSLHCAQALHHSILSELGQHNAHVSRLVHHASRATDATAVLKYAPQAAKEAARAGAHREAASYLLTALRHADLLNMAEKARMWEAHANECHLINDVSRAIESGWQAHQLWKSLGDIPAQCRMLLLLGNQYWKSGDRRLAERQVDDAIALLESLPPSRDLAMGYSARARLGMTAGNVEEAVAFGKRAIELAERLASQDVEAHALNNMGTALLAAGDPAGLPLLQKSLAISLEHKLQDHAGRAYANLVSSTVGQRLESLARQYLREGIEYCEVHEVEDCLNYIRAYGAQLYLDCGEWDDAAQVAGELLDRYSAAVAQRIPALVALARVRMRRGDPGVDQLLDEASRLALQTGEYQRIGRVAAARAEAAWYNGDLKRVGIEATEGQRAAPTRADPWIASELAFWRHRADPSIAITPSIEPFRQMVRGNWDAAATLWGELGMPYQRAMALIEADDKSQKEALTILETLGAGPLAAIARQRLRAGGTRRIPSGPRPSTHTSLAGLTPREVEVLKLLARGHSNNALARRLHVSSRTVEHHVAAILEKLAVRSRTEAVVAAFELGLASLD
jgi:DNA-binding CsgD family transcriptional regulator/tetratricopeptide (TPR) repeat protein